MHFPNKILKNSFLYSIGNIFPKAISFFLLPLYTRYLTPEDYGIVYAMEVLSGVLIILFTFSIERSIYRLFYDYKLISEQKDFLGTLASAIIFNATFILFIIFIFQSSISLVFQSIPFYPYYSYAIISTYLSVFGIIPKVIYQVKEEAKYFVIISLIQFLVNSSLVVYFIIWQKEGALGMLKGSLYSSLILLPIFILLLFKLCNITLNISMLKSSLTYSLPMFPIIMSAWVLNLSDRIFIEKYYTVAEVGIYSLAYKVGGLVLLVVSSIEMAFNPIFYKIANSHDQSEAKKTLYKYVNGYILIILIVCFIIALFSNDFISIFINRNYYESAKIIPLICIAYFISISTGTYNLMIYQSKQTKFMMYATVICAFISILMNFIFVPLFGIIGAALASIIAYLCVGIIKYTYAKKCYYIPINTKLIAFSSIIAVSIYILFTQIISQSSILLSFTLKIMLVIPVFTIILLRYRRLPAI